MLFCPENYNVAYHFIHINFTPLQSLPYQNNPDLFPHLTAWFRYRSSKFDGFKRLEQIWKGATTFLNQTPVASEADYHPLTEAEEQRWKTLERKAKQENLSGHDSAEYEILLEVKLYNRYRIEYPQLTHEALLNLVRQVL